jgi:hypothetical protein
VLQVICKCICYMSFLCRRKEPWSCQLQFKPTYLLHGAESFLRADRFPASQEIPHILWNPTVYHRVHKCPSPVPVLSQIDPVHAFYFNIILSSTSGSSKWSLSPKYPHQNFVHTSALPHTCYTPRPSHCSR